jgi:hypothetical protein
VLLDRRRATAKRESVKQAGSLSIAIELTEPIGDLGETVRYGAGFVGGLQDVMRKLLIYRAESSFGHFAFSGWKPPVKTCLDKTGRL